MPLKLEIGDLFPDLELSDDRDQKLSISTVANGQPLILAFFRGPW